MQLPERRANSLATTISAALVVVSSSVAGADSGESSDPDTTSTSTSSTPPPATEPPTVHQRGFETSLYIRGWLGRAWGSVGTTAEPLTTGWAYGARAELLLPKKSAFGASDSSDPRWSVGAYGEIGSNGLKTAMFGAGLLLHTPSTWRLPLAPSFGVHTSDLRPWNVGLSASVYLDIGGYDVFGVRVGTHQGLGEQPERIWYVALDFHFLVPLVPVVLPFALLGGGNFGNLGSAGGRPLRLDGQPVLPMVVCTAAPHQTGLEPNVQHLTAAERAWLAEAWLQDAMLEHASIAAFTSIARDLLSLGAPWSLVAACYQAANDEIVHARHAFVLASAYAGRPLSAGEMSPFPLAPRPARSRAVLLGEMLRDAIADGAIGEGIAAACATKAARLVTDPAVRQALEQVVIDETRHAALGWAIAQFCISGLSHDQARQAIREAQRQSAPIRCARRARNVDKFNLAAHGKPTRATLRPIERRVRASAFRRISTLLEVAMKNNIDKAIEVGVKPARLTTDDKAMRQSNDKVTTR